MSECTHDCESCGQDCSERKTSFLEEPHRLSHIKKVIGVVSGKGGVGKSSVTSMLAVLTRRDGFKRRRRYRPVYPQGLWAKAKGRRNRGGNFAGADQNRH